MTDPIASAGMAAGLCVLCWFTGYGFGRVKRFWYRVMHKASH